MSPGPPKSFDRQEVLSRAMELFWAKGYQATGMSELLGHVGIGRQSLYNTFGSKRELFLEALDNYKSTMVRQTVRQLEAPGSPLDNVERVLREWIIEHQADGFKGCMMGRTSSEFGGSDPEIAEIVSRSFNVVQDAFADAFERALEVGELRPTSNGRTVSSRALARLIMSATQGIALLGNLEPDRLLEEIETLIALLPRT